jgi:glycine betaine transporter
VRRARPAWPRCISGYDCIAVAKPAVDTRRPTSDPRGSSQDGSPPGEGPRHRPGSVFWISVALAAAFVVLGVFATDTFNDTLGVVVDHIIDGLGWLYLLITTGFLVFVLWLAFSRYGSIRLGKDGENPEFGLFSWFAMLFQAGMGIGLLFWGVSEPVLHAAQPPLGLEQARTPEAAALGIQYSFFHWGLHPWAIYAVVGLAVGYFSYRRGANSLRISVVLRPVMGDRVDGVVGQAVDVLAILATLFGIAVSLGLGTLQLEAGLSQAFGAPEGVGVQIGIIGITAAAYMLSAATPVERGIRGLSNLSMVVAVMLLGYFLVVGPTVLELNTMTQGLGDYASGLVTMSLRTSAFDPSGWLGEWTLFFWATWIAWAPYVGAFIARISRGRTIREFVVGVLLAPTVFSIVWFGVFGAAGIDADRATHGAIARAADQDAANGMFTFIEQFPLVGLISGVTIFLVWIFFVAGADAGTVVLGSMSSRGEDDPRRSVKLTWGVIMGAIAAVLLAAGGLDALQSGAIVAATPFGLLMIAICWALVRALREDCDDPAALSPSTSTQ